MDEQAEYAVLSKAAYDFFHGREALTQLELQEYGLGDHSIDEALSDDRAVVITRPDGSAVVSYRGTDHMSDLAPDFQIALGYHHNPVLQSMGAAASQWAGDRFADQLFRAAETVDVCGIYERHAQVDGALHQPNAFVLVNRVIEAIATHIVGTQSDSGNADVA